MTRGDIERARDMLAIGSAWLNGFAAAALIALALIHIARVMT